MMTREDNDDLNGVTDRTECCANVEDPAPSSTSLRHGVGPCGPGDEGGMDLEQLMGIQIPILRKYKYKVTKMGEMPPKSVGWTGPRMCTKQVDRKMLEEATLDELMDDDLVKTVCEMVEDTFMYDGLQVLDQQIGWNMDRGMEVDVNGMVEDWKTIMVRWRVAELYPQEEVKLQII